MIRTLSIRADRMRAALESNDAMLATELANYLVRKGIPFRESHGLVGQAVRRAETLDVPLREMSLKTYQTVSPAFESDLYEELDFEVAVERRDAVGGTARSAVEAQLAQARSSLDFQPQPPAWPPQRTPAAV